MIDVTQQINAVRRSVGARVIEAGEMRVVTVSQTYDSTVEDVWDACTNPERIPRWFLPVSGELRLGGRYQLEGNAAGTVERCDPPKGFAATWEYGGGMSWIEVSLSTDMDGRTRFQLEHLATVGDEQHWDEFGPGAVGIGWDMAVMGLALHMASAHPEDTEVVNAWLAGDEGKRFLTLSGERWYEADVAAGADKAKARSAADRCAAAYTGAFPGEEPTGSEG
ncbi:SRPBCC family protein [Actinomadura sp. HBU206391]|uniref:SRPBCC family protein n=1 Tax=Actinomadura sp. HBU206391 TaxID=2731692 RepID=UPI0016503CE5|nr:SRPBCC family protein [Actinomadura sp. HBU206391]MBC6460602.1 SRPBCC family protein [Actinomadura sp. HBU206391]